MLEEINQTLNKNMSVKSSLFEEKSKGLIEELYKTLEEYFEDALKTVQNQVSLLIREPINESLQMSHSIKNLCPERLSLLASEIAQINRQKLDVKIKSKMESLKKVAGDLAKNSNCEFRLDEIVNFDLFYSKVEDLMKKFDDILPNVYADLKQNLAIRVTKKSHRLKETDFFSDTEVLEQSRKISKKKIKRLLANLKNSHLASNSDRSSFSDDDESNKKNFKQLFYSYSDSLLYQDNLEMDVGCFNDNDHSLSSDTSSVSSNYCLDQEPFNSLSNSFSSCSINDDYDRDLFRNFQINSDSDEELASLEAQNLNQDEDCIIICENQNDYQTKARKSKKLNKCLQIIEKFVSTNKELKVPRQQISLGMRCLALKDRNRFKWKLARITRITDNNLLSHQVTSSENNSSQIYKMICNCKYTVKFDSDEEDASEPQDSMDDNINKELEPTMSEKGDNESDAAEQVVDNSTSDDEIIECTANENNNVKKRKLKCNTSELKCCSERRYVKKRTNPSSMGLVELDAKSVAFLDNYEFIPNIYSNKMQNRALFEPKSRVVTLYQMKIITCDKSKVLFESEYMSSGTVLEVPSIANFRRYLVLFDNGVALYVKPDHLFPIFDMFGQPLDLLNLDHLMFLQNYCRIYPERKLVRLNADDLVQVFFNNRWCTSKVVDVEGSLVSLLVKSTFFNRKKLSQPLVYSIKLHRGSFCLFPMYEQFISFLENSIKNCCELSPFEEYIKDKRNDTVQNMSSKKYISYFASSIFPNVGLKSKVSKQKYLEITNQKSSNEKVIQGQLKHLNMENMMRDEIIPFVPHPCTNACVAKWENRFTDVKGVNPLLIPVLHGWQRHIGNISKNPTTMTKKFIRYVTPCGRMLRSTAEIDHYLYLTNSKLTIDMFTTDNYIHTDREFEANAKNLKINDIANGQENVAISVVNCVDSNKPDDFVYSAKRIPLDGVPLNTDPTLMEGCNCIDNCRDRTKCACWRKSFEATLFNSDQMNTNIGYRGRRLLEIVHTGNNCKCDCRCSNRVVQNGISVRLQLFKTNSKGWGLRCLDDIPKGTFICNYSGHLITEELSDIRGRELGDEYFAELDFVEYLKRSQNGIVKNIEEFSSKNSDLDESNLKIMQKKANSRFKEYQRPKQQQNANKKNSSFEETFYILLDSDEDEQDRSNPNTFPISKKEDEYNKNRVLNRQQKEKKMVSSIYSNRFFTNHNNKFFFENYMLDSSVFIMDAKILGNIGRYFNHSCAPNIFVQNVFVDTYDLRFPWIAFFANHAIKAGTELCWDYNYTIGSVQDRILFCHCNASNCRGRLL
ncbi:histone-lysine N-methyltransferase eggless isoform X4 [Brachionus plicatilis]|uniref:Histone-lysine N-methyltransferase eggless isoform X4 n=1 Tax=Brachionus plicatilis TaxID=10195 RepID=A0A3M7S9S1_BRAPC|nr:histone-lysine N-methyltransferase eggless isoform X4 [Brachionus plicatilis]